jgi:predicted transglutaminase-like cysteine proteinase
MIRKIAFTFAALAAMATSADAINLGATRALKPKASQTLAAPVGYQVFCLKNKSECRGGGATSIAYTSSTAAVLRRVNDAVNRSVRYRSDNAEVWTVGQSAGDCEDFALTKRSRLIRAGMPPGALRMATARTRTGELHAVLIVKTDKGDFVLDNIRTAIVPRGQSGYRYLKIATSNPAIWQQAKSGREI